MFVPVRFQDTPFSRDRDDHFYQRENMRMCVNERERRVSDEREREKEVYFVKRGSPTQLIAASARRDIVINKYRIKRMNPIDTLRQGR